MSLNMYLDIVWYRTYFTSTSLNFGINCSSYILIAAGKCDVCARELPKDKKERGVSIREGGGVGQFWPGNEHCCGQHQSTIKKNEWKNFLWVVIYPFHRKIERAMCVCGWKMEMQAVMASHSEMYEAM